jgi:hypothetical protein
MWRVAQMWGAKLIGAELKDFRAGLQLLYTTGIMAIRNRI